MARALVLGCVCVLLAAAASEAEETVPGTEPGAGPARGRGFLIGYAIGMGRVSSDPCGDCWYQPRGLLELSHSVHVGWMVGRRVALMLESTGVGNDTADHALVVVAGQWWMSPAGRLWLKAGLGIGSYVLGDTKDAGSAPTYATVLGEGGFEVVRHHRWTVDLQVRGAGTKRPDRWGSSVAAGIGVNWYAGWR